MEPVSPLSEWGIDQAKRGRYLNYRTYFDAADATGITAGALAILAILPVAPVFGVLVLIYRGFRPFLKFTAISFAPSAILGLVAGGLCMEGFRRKRFVTEGLPRTADCRLLRLESMLEFDREKAVRQGLLGPHAARSLTPAIALWSDIQNAKREALDAIQAWAEREIAALPRDDLQALAEQQNAIWDRAGLAKVKVAKDWDEEGDKVKDWYANELYISYLNEISDGVRASKAAFMGSLS